MKNKKDAKTIISSDKVKIYYWVTKRPRMKKSWIIIHAGASMNHSSLQGIEKRLNKLGHPTIIFDQRGIGYSEAPPKKEYYSLKRYSEDLQNIIEQEKLKKPDIFTHSFGFMIAINYLSKTRNLGKITAVCASNNFLKTTNHFLFYVGGKIFGLDDYLVWFANWLTKKLTGGKSEYSEQDLEGKSDLSVMHALANVPFKELLVHRTNCGLDHWDISEQLKNVKNPIQLIYSEDDLLVQPYAGKEIAKLVKGKCDISVVEGTHTLPITHPERVLKVMKYK